MAAVRDLESEAARRAAVVVELTEARAALQRFESELAATLVVQNCHYLFLLYLACRLWPCPCPQLVWPCPQLVWPWPCPHFIIGPFAVCVIFLSI